MHEDPHQTALPTTVFQLAADELGLRLEMAEECVTKLNNTVENDSSLVEHRRRRVSSVPRWPARLSAIARELADNMAVCVEELECSHAGLCHLKNEWGCPCASSRTIADRCLPSTPAKNRSFPRNPSLRRAWIFALRTGPAGKD
jgi:hypothetical protein